MYASADIPEKIKALAKEKKIAVKTMLSDLNMGPNTMSNFKTSMPKCDTLARIADYLDCSVDYLLGRTDNPKSHISAAAVEEEIAKADQVIKTAKHHLKSNLAEMQVRRELERKMMLAKYLEGLKIAAGSDLFDGVEIVAIGKTAKKHEGEAK